MMDTLRNKPRVFLSHSKKDLSFIEKIEADLRRCQIDPWIDSIEIRHGQPWLDAIFESGIPNCDSVLIYLTPHSIKSKVVKKEIDAGILQKLNDSHISFLPYVSDEDTRLLLRFDIQTLQVPVWHNSNYHDIFPQVVAEIWRSFMERSIIQSTQIEKIRRLEAELKLKEIQEKEAKNLFSEQENIDFEYIHNTLNENDIVINQITKNGKTENKQEAIYSVTKLSLLIFTLDNYPFQFHESYLHNVLYKAFKSYFAKSEVLSEKLNIHFQAPEFISELLMFGLIQWEQYIDSSSRHNTPLTRIESKKRLIFSPKIFRFKYWLAVNKLMPQELSFTPKDEIY